MKRSEVEIGVEYAEHGPMAYGVIPSGRPGRVRFISKDPNLRLIKTYRKVSVNDKGQGQWEEVRTEYSKEYTFHPSSLHVEEARLVPVGEEFTVYRPSDSPVGALPGEVTYDGGTSWHLHSVQPAAVHMTWAEWVRAEHAKDTKARERRIEAAPNQMVRDWSSLVERARLLKYTEADLRAWVDERIRHTVL